MTPIDSLLFVAAILLLLSLFASKASLQLGIPSLLLFLGVGMLAGSDGIGGIVFNDPGLAQSIGVVSLAFILFSGGLETNLRRIQPVLWAGASLSTLGVLLTAVLVATFACYTLGFSWTEGLLLGSIVSATDSAAIFSVLRSRHFGLKGSLGALLELESGTNDPMAAFLVIALVSKIQHPELGALEFVGSFLQQAGLGVFLGFALGRGTLLLINRIQLGHDGLYPVFTLAMVMLTYATTASVGGSGFLAVYLAGLVLGNGEFIHKRSLRQFHDGLAWLTQIAMFLSLGLLVYPSELPGLFGIGSALAFFLIFIARPLGVFICLAFSKLGFKEKLFVSWVGLRGSVPIVLATFPWLAGVPKAEMLFNVVFFIVILSVALQGASLSHAARWLGVIREEKDWEPPFSDRVEMEGETPLEEVEVSEGSSVAGRRVIDLNLPEQVLLVLIRRRNESIVPRGDTVLEVGDKVFFVAASHVLANAYHLLGQGQA